MKTFNKPKECEIKFTLIANLNPYKYKGYSLECIFINNKSKKYTSKMNYNSL